MSELEDKDESLISHIEAFRKMLLKCLTCYALVLLPALFAAPKCLELFIKLIIRGHDIALNYFSPAEVFIIQIKLAMVIDLVICFPYIAKQIWEFCAPALYENEKKELCTLIYYPEQKLQLIKEAVPDISSWYSVTLNRLVKVCQNVSSKYTRSKVRKALPEEFSYIIQELLHESSMDPNKQAYINVIISTIIDTDRADDFIIAMCNLIQQLTIDSLHILGDIFDRGPGPHIILDTLCDYHHFDIQWGKGEP